MSIRIAGAQIPVGTDIQANKKEIINAIEWAKENNVDQLVTPECALSGYLYYWTEKIEEIEESLKEIEEFQKKCKVGLHLGTNFKEPEVQGDINRNQIRHYSKEGNLKGITNKTFVVSDFEIVMPRSQLYDTLTIFDIDENQFAAGLICNDMWGHQEVDRRPISSTYKTMGLSLIIHSTNGLKYDADQVEYEVFQQWHEAYLRMTSFTCPTPIITVDSCTQWNWDGNEDDVEKYTTSSKSGVLIKGEWKKTAPRLGRQYFYYDIPHIERILK